LERLSKEILHGTLAHRCTSKQIFGGAKDFCPNFPKLPKKLSCNICRPFSWCDLQKWSALVFLQTLGAIFRSQTTLGAIFAQIFSDFVRIFRDFVQIFRDFARIFDKSKILGVRLHPLHTVPLYNIATLCNRNKKKKRILFRKAQRAACGFEPVHAAREPQFGHSSTT